MARNERRLSIRLDVKDGETVKRALLQLGDEGKRALERIEGASRPASKGLLAVNAAGREGAQIIEGYAQSTGPLGAALSAIGPAGLAAAAGIGALTLGIKQALDQAQRAVDSLDDLGRWAGRIGISAQALQELRFAAASTGVEVEDLDDAMKELALRSVEAAELGGEPLEAFQRLGFTQRELREQVGDTDALFKEIVKRFEELGTAGEGVLTADQLFGGDNGARLLNLLRMGADGVARLREEARAAGVVFEQDMIDNAVETNAQLRIMHMIIDANLNRAFVDLAPVIVGVTSAVAVLARALSETVDQMRALENQSTRSIENQLQRDRERLETLRNRQGAQQPGFWQRRLRDVGQGARTAASQGLDFADTYTAQGVQREIAELEKSILKAEDELARRRSENNEKTKNDAIELADFVVDANQKIIDSLQRQIEMQRLTAEEGERAAFVYQQASALSKDSTAEERAEVERLAGTLFDLREAYEASRRAAEEADKQREESVRRMKQEREEAIRAQIQQLERDIATAQRLTFRNLAPGERFRADVAGLDRLRGTGAMSDRAYEQELERARRQLLFASTDALSGMQQAIVQFQDFAGTAADQVAEAFTGAFRSIEDELFELTQTGEFSFERLVNSINAQLSRIAVRNITSSIAGAFGGAADSLFGPTEASPLINVPSFHRGGVVGEPPPAMRMAHPALFDRADSYAMGGGVRGVGGMGGLKPFELPAILERGEIVIPRAQAANARRGGNTITVNMTINTPNADSFRRSERQIRERLGAMAAGAFSGR